MTSAVKLWLWPCRHQTHPWWSWTWVTMTCVTQEWSCSLLDWRAHTSSWRYWGFSIIKNIGTF